MTYSCQDKIGKEIQCPKVILFRKMLVNKYPISLFFVWKTQNCIVYDLSSGLQKILSPSCLQSGVTNFPHIFGALSVVALKFCILGTP